MTARDAARAVPAAGPELAGHYLHPGQLHASAAPMLVTTILGTCVAVGLWDAQARVGGLNHYLLPSDPSGTAGPRVGASAIVTLHEWVLRLGAAPERLRAKVFGGTQSAFGFERGGRDLGAQNAAIAFEWLAARGIPVVASDVGGARARKLLFQTADGLSWVKYL